MSKRFLITEDERNSILSLYTKKGIIIEQDFTTGDKPKKEELPLFSLGTYDILVNGNNLTVTYIDERDGQRYSAHPDSETVSGNLFELKYDLINRNFIDGKVISMTTEQFNQMKTEEGSYAAILGDILQDVELSNIPPDIIGYALGIQAGIPSIFYITPAISTLDKPGYRHIDTPQVTMHDLFLPSRREYDDTSNIRNLMTYVNTGTVNGVKSTSGRYVYRGLGNYDIKWKEFKKQYGISITTIKGPEGKGYTYEREIVPIEIKLELSDPFKFDKTDLTTEAQNNFDLFIQKINDVKIKYGDEIFSEYANFLKNNKVKITTSASIDNDPKGITANSNNPLTRTLESCRKPGGRPRKEYNQCLSEARVKVIYQKLNNEFPELKGAFVPNAIGETDQFDTGKKWPEVKNSDLTAKNRRLEIIFPVFQKKG